MKFIRIFNTIIDREDISYITTGANKVIFYLKSGGNIVFETDEVDIFMDKIEEMLS